MQTFLGWIEIENQDCVFFISLPNIMWFLESPTSTITTTNDRSFPCLFQEAVVRRLPSMRGSPSCSVVSLVAALAAPTTVRVAAVPVPSLQGPPTPTPPTDQTFPVRLSLLIVWAMAREVWHPAMRWHMDNVLREETMEGTMRHPRCNPRVTTRQDWRDPVTTRVSSLQLRSWMSDWMGSGQYTWKYLCVTYTLSWGNQKSGVGVIQLVAILQVPSYF